MCGIVGIISHEEEIKSQITNLLQIQNHRGPDRSGVFKCNNVALGHNRLSIIDLDDRSNQPFFSYNKNEIIIFNGEIYNYKELSLILINHGVKLRTTSDTEVLIEYISLFGLEKTLSDINGMYAFAVFFKNKNELVIVRDRIGEKPIYYSKFGNNILFASEVRTLISSEYLKKFFSFDDEMYNSHIYFPFNIDPEKTYIKGIQKLEPASVLVIDTKNILIKKKFKYWSLKEKEKFASINENEACEKLEELLSESVNQRMVADRPVGIMLSGGMDSSLITAFSKKKNKSINTFSLKFNSILNENNFSNLVSKKFQTNHQIIEIDEEENIRNIEKNIYAFDDLSSTDAGTLSIYAASKKIKDYTDIKVLLFGEGADEILCGYNRFAIGNFPFLLPKKIAFLFYLFFLTRSNNVFFDRDIWKLYNKKASLLKTYNFFEVNKSLPNHFLMKIDKPTMQNSIEARVPFLDYKLIEFTYSIQDQLKLKIKGTKILEKYIEKKISKRILPKEIFNRKKFGMMFNLNLSIKNQINYIESRILDNKNFINIINKNLLNKSILKIKNDKCKLEDYNLIWKVYLLSAFKEVNKI